MNLRLVMGGLKSYLPLPSANYTGTGGTSTGAYCYTVWLRHLILTTRHLGGVAPPISTVVELGPGDSIGLGLAALLTGADRYIGLDVLAHASIETNLRVLDELVALFRQRAPLPDDVAFPRTYPRLASYAFPRGLIDESVLADRLSDENVNRLKEAVRNADAGNGTVQYRWPWSAASVAPASVDLIISQGALQDMDHAPGKDDLANNIAAMATWLKPSGVMSHHIELSCPGGEKWNHHWAYGDLTWSLIRGKRPYYKNRVSLSQYVTLIEATGCRAVGVEPVIRNGLRRDETAQRFRRLSDEDFCTAAALLVCVKD
jgi:hypothetical protein